MKNIIKKMKKNKAGFSLLEILLAVVLLAIVVTPLIQTIYSSMALNNRARIMMGAQEFGQTIIEDLESKPYDGNITTNHWGLGYVSGGNYYEADIRLSPMFTGSNYTLYEIKVDIYYLPNNNASQKEFIATYKGSMYSKFD